jgi:hypothetical protein
LADLRTRLAMHRNHLFCAGIIIVLKHRPLRFMCKPICTGGATQWFHVEQKSYGGNTDRCGDTTALFVIAL